MTHRTFWLAAALAVFAVQPAAAGEKGVSVPSYVIRYEALPDTGVIHAGPLAGTASAPSQPAAAPGGARAMVAAPARSDRTVTRDRSALFAERNRLLAEARARGLR